MNDLILEAVAIIAGYNPKLATLFADRPFQRVLLAKAFLAGFTTTPETCQLVLDIAELDKKFRQRDNAPVKNGVRSHRLKA